MIKSYQISSLENIMPKTERNFVNINEITIIRGEITFENCARNAETILNVRNSIINELRKFI